MSRREDRATCMCIFAERVQTIDEIAAITAGCKYKIEIGECLRIE
jgi:hypothetical protein